MRAVGIYLFVGAWHSYLLLSCMFWSNLHCSLMMRILLISREATPSPEAVSVLG
jgi:hypothetical protein